MQHPKPIVRRLLPAILLIANAEASPNNFCGNDWNDASTDCQNRQPCPGELVIILSWAFSKINNWNCKWTNHFILGATDDECDSGICWADTLCDTNKGDGILFDKDNPQHQRFCGELVMILLGFQ